jgi:hypothetical protein
MSRPHAAGDVARRASGLNGDDACQPVDRTSFPGLAPVSSPFSKMGVPEQIVMS